MYQFVSSVLPGGGGQPTANSESLTVSADDAVVFASTSDDVLQDSDPGDIDGGTSLDVLAVDIPAVTLPQNVAAAEPPAPALAQVPIELPSEVDLDLLGDDDQLDMLALVVSV